MAIERNRYSVSRGPGYTIGIDASRSAGKMDFHFKDQGRFGDYKISMMGMDNKQIVDKEMPHLRCVPTEAEF